MTVWFDVEDLVTYFQNVLRPTGIQRLSFETYRAVWRLAGEQGDVRFCRRSANRNGFRSIHFPALEAGVLAAAACCPDAKQKAIKAPELSALGTAMRRLPLKYRLPIGVMSRALQSGLGGAKDLAIAALEPIRRGPAPRRAVGGHQFDLDGPEIKFAAGDWFINLGAPWGTPYDPEFLASLRAQGASLGFLAHDLIPELFPEWFTDVMVQEFTTWLRDIVPQADLMFAVSSNTAADLVKCMAQIGRTVAPVAVLPVGSHVPEASFAQPPMLADPYVLMVGTIEARKNHGAMMRVWRRLLEAMPAADVPELVFAGKVGWLTADLMQQLENARWFNGKIRFIDSPSESQLANLYQHCRFTVFPSLYEGWGLPVTESLAHGKMVAASNRAAIPEAGGNFCAYFDPDNVTDAFNVIRGLIENPARVTAMEARIKLEYRPTAWDHTAAALLAQLGVEQTVLAAPVKLRLSAE